MWFYLALGMAGLSGIYTVLSKHTLKSVDPVVFYWVTILVSAPPLGILAFREGIPELKEFFILSIIAGDVFYTTSKIIFYKTLKDATLSHVYPLVTIGPVFTLIWSYLILNEQFTLLNLVGSAVTLVGVYILNVSSMKEGLLEPFKILFRNKFALLTLISVFLASFTSIFDKMAISNTEPSHPIFAAFAEQLIIIFTMLPFILLKKKQAFKEITQNFGMIVLVGLIFTGGTILAFFALRDGNPGLVTSVFRTQVFFAFIFSAIFLRDYPKTETVLGTIIMILGLVITKLSL